MSIGSQRNWSAGLCLAVLVLLAAPAFAKDNSPARPNIVLILTDDMGFGDVGCYGGKFAPTPNIDRMAREGIRFTQYYSASPICSPSRTGILTGMYPARHGIMGCHSFDRAEFIHRWYPPEGFGRSFRR